MSLFREDRCNGGRRTSQSASRSHQMSHPGRGEHEARGESTGSALLRAQDNSLTVRGRGAHRDPDQPKTSATSIAKLPAKKKHELEVEGMPQFNDEGGWMKLVSPHSGNWVLVQPSKIALKVKWNILENNGTEPSNWFDMVEQLYSLQLVKQTLPSSCDSEETPITASPAPWVEPGGG